MTTVQSYWPLTLTSHIDRSYNNRMAKVTLYLGKPLRGTWTCYCYGQPPGEPLLICSLHLLCEEESFPTGALLSHHKEWPYLCGHSTQFLQPHLHHLQPNHAPHTSQNQAHILLPLINLSIYDNKLDEAWKLLSWEYISAYLHRICQNEILTTLLTYAAIHRLHVHVSLDIYTSHFSAKLMYRFHFFLFFYGNYRSVKAVFLIH